MIIHLGDHYIESSSVIAIREASKSQTSIWCTGQSAVDGAFLVDEDIDTVLERLNALQTHALGMQLLDQIDREREERNAGSGQDAVGAGISRDED